MRFGLAARGLGNSMIKCIESYGSHVERASHRNHHYIDATTGRDISYTNTYDSYLLLCHHTNRFIDILNGRFGNFGSPNQDLLYDLLDYVKFLTHWRAQCLAIDRPWAPYFFFPESTYQDTVWCALSFVIMARRQLPIGHEIVQSRGGSDRAEETFAELRGRNPGASAMSTDGALANVSGRALQNLAASRKRNVTKDTVFKMGDIESVVMKRRSI